MWQLSILRKQRKEDEYNTEWYNGISPSSEMSLWSEWYAWIDALFSLSPQLIVILIIATCLLWAFDVDVRMASKRNEMRLIAAVLWLEGTVYLNVWKTFIKYSLMYEKDMHNFKLLWNIWLLQCKFAAYIVYLGHN